VLASDHGIVQVLLSVGKENIGICKRKRFIFILVIKSAKDVPHDIESGYLFIIRPVDGQCALS
jgi:hypothetical protein